MIRHTSNDKLAVRTDGRALVLKLEKYSCGLRANRSMTTTGRKFSRNFLGGMLWLEKIGGDRAESWHVVRGSEREPSFSCGADDVAGDDFLRFPS